ncbi:class I SAM-dependent methyltransferase [Methylobacterium trifolii]|uniref:Mycinamicin VI 2''-O-methyltransferase n=1 Tax=Methylobacterium trifolii TaxID=1003092 RepID=A0ABQ4U0I4_9HYPH|nr:class I SAM-dependent methyltransferase [Methylobacterium trifolii]GJE60387.1 Mycinamicin VI 2''-O-methyltransferase [Methylobacterium trifolii]
MRLWQDFTTNQGRTIHKWAHYFPAYERHFSPFVGRPIRFLEIGIGDGGSVEMWKRYFGPYAHFVGLDNRQTCKAFEDDQFSVRIGDQSNAEFLDSVLAEFGVPDIVLDDGSHMMSDVCATFLHLYPKMHHHGVYMVEDLHTAYLSAFGGGVRREGTFIEIAKGLIDELNVHPHTENSETTEFGRNTNSISFYNSMAVFERGIPLPRLPMMLGSTPHYGGPTE